MSKVQKRRFWSTLDEYENSPHVRELKGEEFLSKPSAVLAEDAEQQDDGIESPSRRDFLKLSGAAAVLSMVSCARPVEKILPYVNAPEEIIPGVANYYASSCDESKSSVLIKTREGRPINLMPNDLDHVSGSGLNSRAFASIVDLYDPARARNSMKMDPAAKAYVWDDAIHEIVEKMKNSDGEVVLLSSTMNGPSRDRLITLLEKEIKNFRHVSIDAESNDQLQSANEKSLSTKTVAHYAFDKAEAVVFLGGDAIADGREMLKNIEGISKNRRIVETGKMSRLFAFEPTITESGLNVDYRYAVKNEDMAFVAMALAHELASVKGLDKSLESTLFKYKAEVVEKQLHLKSGTIKFVAEELYKNKGKSIVYAEGAANRTENGEALHIATNFLNSILGNIGTTIDYGVNHGKQSLGSQKAFDALLSDMEASKVSTLFIYNTNPSYFYAESDRFNKALKKVALSVSFNDRLDESSKHCNYLLPSAHTLESWGDREYVNGFYTIVQPSINAIWGSQQVEHSLMTIAKALGSTAFDDPKGKLMEYHAFVQNTWREIHKKQAIASSFERFWITVVRDGVYDTIKDRTRFKNLTFNKAALESLQLKKTKDELTLSVFIGSTKGDGSQGNNAYLLEAPDPISKITWDNFLALAPETAKSLGLWINDLAEIDVAGKKITLPVNIQPGMHKHVATLAAGWGRTDAGAIGGGEKDSSGKFLGQGVNAFAFTHSGNFSGHPIKISKASAQYKLADTQGHQYLDDKQRFIDLHDHHKENYRPIVFETTLKEYQEDPEALVKYHTKELTDQIKNNKIDNLWDVSTEDSHKYPGHRWGMVVDLNSCVGCNACVVACQIENNIPVVGRSEVLLGREMHWMRIDRYYVGEADDPEVVMQPMMCQHCTNAPCETVCPVVATTHNQEGLNVMTYNRCVGTRYCANNCPYKVRRFNFHEYTKGDATKGAPSLGFGSANGLNQKNYDLSQYPMQMMLNPDITVREKGVMEKCSMCSHKIREAKYEAKLKGLSINDLDNASTACETACPANSITFGDINDENSDVSKLKKSPLNFASLAELNVKPNVSYISVVRNQDEAYWHNNESEEAEH